MKLQKGDYVNIEGCTLEQVKKVRDAFVNAGFKVQTQPVNALDVYKLYGIDSDYGSLHGWDVPTTFDLNPRYLTIDEVIATLPNEGWIDLEGEDCPVPGSTIIEAYLDNAETRRSCASSFDWTLSDDTFNIIRYRIIDQVIATLPNALVLDQEDAKHEDEEFARVAKAMPKQERYKREDGTDTIDKWAKEYTPERFRHVMWAQVDKYHDRLGNKDPIAQEVRKMADYMNRWALVEEGRKV